MIDETDEYWATRSEWLLDMFNREPEASFDQVADHLYQGDSDAWRDEFWQGLGQDAAFVDLSGMSENNPMDGFDGKLRVLLPIDDGPMPRPDTIRGIAKLVAALTETHEVLVSCAAGWNRSGLVVARALIELGHGAYDAIQLVRDARGPYALSNPHFEAWLKREDDLTLAGSYARLEAQRD